MSTNTTIEWTDATWNPTRGCSRVSPGCQRCYAERQARRFAGASGPYEGLLHANGSWNGKIRLVEDALTQPLHWAKGRRVFVDSMSDLFHENIPFEFIDKVFAVMSATDRHTYQVLTKRPERMLEWFARLTPDEDFGMEAGPEVTAQKVLLRGKPQHGKRRGGYDNCGLDWPLRNVWLGVSVENQETADERIPLLLRTPAAVRFLSCEPLLGPIDFRKVPGFNRIGLDLSNWWVIAGGESGPKARPSHPDWFRSLRDLCHAVGVPYFFKQWGEWAPGECAPGPQTRTEQVATWWNGEWHFGRQTPREGSECHRDDEPDLYRFGKKSAGRLLDGRTWDQFPEINPPHRPEAGL